MRVKEFTVVCPLASFNIAQPMPHLFFPYAYSGLDDRGF